MPSILLSVSPCPVLGPEGKIGYALCEDGDCLTSHVSSTLDWAKYDMGLTSQRKHDLYAAKYPEGYELVWIDNPNTDPRWLAAIELNRAEEDEEALDDLQ